MTGEPERPVAVAVMRGISAAGQVLTLRAVRWAVRRVAGKPVWPAYPGGYVVGDRSSSVAVCTLSDAGLAERAAALPGVAIAGCLYTANLGMERIIGDVTSNPRSFARSLPGPSSRKAANREPGASPRLSARPPPGTRHAKIIFRG